MNVKKVQRKAAETQSNAKKNGEIFAILGALRAFAVRFQRLLA